MSGIVGSKAARASGGTVSTVGGYTLHTFTAGSSSFTPATTGFIDVLAIGGGGACGPGGVGPSGGSAGGAGAVIFRKFVPVVAGTPYPIVVGPGGTGATGPNFSVGNPGGNTTISISGITTAYGGGAGGANGNGAGSPSPFASGGGGGSYYNGGPGGTGGTGFGAIGYGFPGFQGGAPNGPRSGGGGGGAGGGGPASTISTTGGPGVPIGYMTGVPTDFAGVGGSVNPGATTSPFYGSGGSGFEYPANFNGPPGRPGVAYIRYI